MQPTDKQSRSKGTDERGSSVIEVSFLAPWIFFLFVGVLDFGFYSYAAISVQNAARAVALYTSSGPGTAADSAGGCTYAKQELGSLPGVTSGMACAALPLIVNAQAVTGPDGAAATQVSVTYQTLPMIPIPGMMMGQMTITRVVQMRLKP
jgi:Flp pilus assembly protein TadG